MDYRKIISAMNKCVQNLISGKYPDLKRFELRKKIEGGIKIIIKKYMNDAKAQRQISKIALIQQLTKIKIELEKFLNT